MELPARSSQFSAQFLHKILIHITCLLKVHTHKIYSNYVRHEHSLALSSNFQIIFHTSLVFWHYCFRPFCLNNSQVSISFLPLNPGFSSCFMHISIWLFRYSVLTKLVSLVFLMSVYVIPNPDLSPAPHMLSVVNICWFSFQGSVVFFFWRGIWIPFQLITWQLIFVGFLFLAWILVFNIFPEIY